jgi:hypothetical protein
MAQLSRNVTSPGTEFLDENVQLSSFGKRDNSDKAKDNQSDIKNRCYLDIFISLARNRHMRKQNVNAICMYAYINRNVWIRILELTDMSRSGQLNISRI